MSPRFTPDLTTVDAGFTIFDKGDYEFEAGEVTSFEAKNDDGSSKNFGVMFPIKEVNGKGKQMIRCYTHTQDAMGFSKRIVMAFLGFNPSQRQAEEEFNNKYRGADWSFNPDDKSVGDMWKLIRGQHAIISLEPGINPKDGSANQKFVGYQPVK